MKTIFKYIVLILLSGAALSCVDLEVENTNNPSIEDVLSTPEGVKQLTGSLFNKWFKAEQHNISSPGPAMWVMADWGTVTFANYACVDMSKEPRIFLNNTSAYGYHGTTRNFWRNMYGVITSANDVIHALDDGIQIGEDGNETMMVRGMCHFMQGLGNGYIGLVYDKGFPSDENVEDYTNLQLQPYQVSVDMAIEELEKAIEIFNTNEFTLPAEWMNGADFTNTRMAQIAHSFIARLMVYTPRNRTQSESVDWTEVLNHAQLGINEDFNIQGDGNVSNRKWMSYYKYYLARPSWGKVDMRIIHMMDNSQPANWPAGGLSDLDFDGIMDTQDARGWDGGDFQHNTSNNRPERGKYRWSTYRYARFDDYINANFFAPVVMMRKAENDLFMAEAYARLGQYDNAANIINAGTRITRGNLESISNDPTEVNNAIIYERTIELPLTGMGIEFFDMRRRDMLQDGSLLHFPIPAQQLEILQEPLYTFGGLVYNSDTSANPRYGVENQDVSINGWYIAPNPND